jgi:hypothetical protein
MPKDELDPEDPFELNGVGLRTHEDTSTEMTECFIEEFVRMGYSAPRVLALFRNPFYFGMNQVLVSRGEPFVRGLIELEFARRGKPVQWADHELQGGVK